MAPSSGSDKRIRVLVVSMMLTRGGAERFTSTLLTHLDRTRFAPSLCLLFPEMGYPLPDDVPVTMLGHRGVGTVFRSIRRLRRLINETQPDVVISTLAYASIVAGEALHRCKKPARWIARIGAPPSVENRGGFLKFVFGRWQRRVYRWADVLVPNSQGTADEMIHDFPATAGRIRVIGNPTDFSTIDQLAAKPPSHQVGGQAPLIISVGRLNQEKRPDLLVEAFVRLRRKMPAMLWLCGDGLWRQRVEQQIASSGHADSIRLLGFCDNPYALMRQADLFVMSSDFEGLPNALIESQGLGIPAVSTRCPYGPAEIVAHGETGLLVNPGDAEGLAQAMEELLSNPARRQAMGHAARKRACELFDVNTLVKRWEQLIESVIGNHQPEASLLRERGE